MGGTPVNDGVCVCESVSQSSWHINWSDMV